MTKAIGLLCMIYILSFSACNDPQTSSNEPKARPNILWITCEDLMPMLGSYGDTYAHSPNLDSLAQVGVRYTRAFATAPVCSPARSSLATGVYATSLGSQHLRSEIRKPDFIQSLSQILMNEGYYCSNNSKEDYNFVDSTMWDESSNTAHWRNRQDPTKPFFSVFNIETTHQSQIFGTDEAFHQKYGHQIPDSLRHDPDRVFVPPYYFDIPLVRKMLARYYDLVYLMDLQVGEILSELNEDGLANNTIVFFYSDHGTGLPRGKRSLYDSGIQVPFIIHAPSPYDSLWGLFPNSVDSQLVSFIDFPPTVLNLLDIEIPDYMQGQPFLGKKIPSPREYVFATSDRVDEAFEVSRAVRGKDFLYIRNYLPHLPLIQDNYYTDQSQIMKELRSQFSAAQLKPEQQSMWASSRNQEELYYVPKDSFQVYNLVDNPAYQSVLNEMREAHNEWILRTYDTGFLPESKMHEWAGDSSIYEMTKNTSLFPLHRIITVTEAARVGELQTVEKMLFEDSEIVRYWAATAMASQADNFTSTSIDALRQMLTDQPDYIKLAAISSLCEMNACDPQNFNIVLDILEQGHEMDQLLAARTFELYATNVKGHPIYQKVSNFTDDLQEKVADKWYGYDLYSYWALSEAFK